MLKLMFSGFAPVAWCVSGDVPDRAGEPGLAPAGEVLFFASPKQSTQKKGEPDSSALRARCVAQLRRGARKLAALKHARPLIRRSLRYSPPHNGGENRAQYPTPQGRAMARPCLHSGCSVSNAVMRRRVAQGQTDQGWRCLSAASLARPRLTRATQLTRASRGATNPARLLFGDFLLAKQEKVTALSGAHPDTLPRQGKHPKRSRAADARLGLQPPC